jgi:hypothetical protein
MKKQKKPVKKRRKKNHFRSARAAKQIGENPARDHLTKLRRKLPPLPHAAPKLRRLSLSI